MLDLDCIRSEQVWSNPDNKRPRLKMRMRIGVMYDFVFCHTGQKVGTHLSNFIKFRQKNK